jgi:hypothetical protein
MSENAKQGVLRLMKPSQLYIDFKDATTNIRYCRYSSTLVNRAYNGFHNISKQLAVNAGTIVKPEIKRKSQAIRHEGQIRIAGNGAVHP